MNITLYKTSSPPNKLDKSLTDDISMTCTLRDETNVMTPSVLLTAGSNSNISDYNYCVIKKLNRNYFITSIESVRNGLWRVHLKCDVLTTYKKEIRQLNAIISKQEKDGKITNKMYNDGTFKNSEETVLKVLEFPNHDVLYNQFNGNPIYLLTVL